MKFNVNNIYIYIYIYISTRIACLDLNKCFKCDWVCLIIDHRLPSTWGVYKLVLLARYHIKRQELHLCPQEWWGRRTSAGHSPAVPGRSALSSLRGPRWALCVVWKIASLIWLWHDILSPCKAHPTAWSPNLSLSPKPRENIEDMETTSLFSCAKSLHTYSSVVTLYIYQYL